MGEDLVGLGKMAEALERGTREFRELVQDFLAPVAKEAGQYLADRIRFNRISAANRALEIAKEQVASSRMEQKPVSPKILASALEGASLEEDGDLISRWAGLIASAATTGETLPAFADILRQLTPEEARMLDFIYEKSRPVSGTGYGVERGPLQENCAVAGDDFVLRIQNLDRLGLVMRLSSTGMDTIGGRGWGGALHIGLTALGQAFVRACRGPAKLVAEGGRK